MRGSALPIVLLTSGAGFAHRSRPSSGSSSTPATRPAAFWGCHAGRPVPARLGRRCGPALYARALNMPTCSRRRAGRRLDQPFRPRQAVMADHHPTCRGIRCMPAARRRWSRRRSATSSLCCSRGPKVLRRRLHLRSRQALTDRAGPAQTVTNGIAPLTAADQPRRKLPRYSPTRGHEAGGLSGQRDPFARSSPDAPRVLQKPSMNAVTDLARAALPRRQPSSPIHDLAVRPARPDARALLVTDQPPACRRSSPCTAPRAARPSAAAASGAMPTTPRRSPTRCACRTA